MPLHYSNSIRHIWIESFFFSCLKKAAYKYYQKKYQLDNWHCIPNRPYTFGIINFLESKIDSSDCIVEIGCGLGEIISFLPNCHKIAVDINPMVIKAAKKLHFLSHKKILFKVGSFEAIQGLNIKYLITVNFAHAINSVNLSKGFEIITQNNNIEYIIADEVTDKYYTYNHKLKNILPSEYKFMRKIGTYPAMKGKRYIVLYKKSL